MRQSVELNEEEIRLACAEFVARKMQLKDNVRADARLRCEPDDRTGEPRFYATVSLRPDLG
jgi:hypothetical protein